MKYLLDTNVCINYLNAHSVGIRKTFETKSAREIVLCSVVKAELLYGALKSSKSEYCLKKLAYFFKAFTSLPFDDTASEEYGRIRTQLEKTGQPIGPHDLLIAAIALSKQLILVTHNTKEFGRIEGLTIEDWE